MNCKRPHGNRVCLDVPFRCDQNHARLVRTLKVELRPNAPGAAAGKGRLDQTEARAPRESEEYQARKT